MIIAIILAGGVGSRVGADRPKQFIEVDGKPILAYTIEIFQKHQEVDEIEVVCHKEWKEYLYDIIKTNHYDKVKYIADGGKNFQESVISGLSNLRGAITLEDYVLIQYGAAPFTSEKIVSDVIKVMKERGNAVSATPCFQLLGTNDGIRSDTWIDREKYIQIACPYGFKYGYILDVYNRAEEQGLLDSIEPHTTSLIYALGDSLYQAYGDQTNIKITTKEDVDLFKGYVLTTKREI